MWSSPAQEQHISIMQEARMQLRRKPKVQGLAKGYKKKQIKWPGPTVGSRRMVVRFAWRPQLLDCGHYVWFERYKSHEEFCRDFDGTKWKVWKKEPIK